MEQGKGSGGRSETLARLEQAGIQVDAVPDVTRKVLETLDPDEVDVLLKVRDKLNRVDAIDKGDLASAIGIFYY